jgi:hypothetical protein
MPAIPWKAALLATSRLYRRLHLHSIELLDVTVEYV